MAEKRKVKVRNLTPWNCAASPTLRNEAVDMRIPFEIASECMQNADEARSKALGMINFMKHTKNNASDSIKKEV